MSTTYTPPTTRYAFPTGNRLLDRLQIPRGLYVITDGAGGWRTVETPYEGDLEGLVEGVDYFIGGHEYQIPDGTPNPPPGVGGPPPPPPPPGGGPFGYGIGGYGEEAYGA